MLPQLRARQLLLGHVFISAGACFEAKARKHLLGLNLTILDP
jgi:hypothetical protein